LDQSSRICFFIRVKPVPDLRDLAHTELSSRA
jgi:hypothetical protein